MFAIAQFVDRFPVLMLFLQISLCCAYTFANKKKNENEIDLIGIYILFAKCLQ